jgi:hypothetical protein
MYARMRDLARYVRFGFGTSGLAETKSTALLTRVVDMHATRIEVVSAHVLADGMLAQAAIGINVSSAADAPHGFTLDAIQAPAAVDSVAPALDREVLPTAHVIAMLTTAPACAADIACAATWTAVFSVAPLLQRVALDADQAEPSADRLVAALDALAPPAESLIAVDRTALTPLVLLDEADHAEPVDRLAPLVDGVAPAAPIRTVVVRVAPDVDGEVAPAARLIVAVSAALAMLGIVPAPASLITAFSAADVAEVLAPAAAICTPADRAAADVDDDVPNAPPRSSVAGAAL